MTDRFRRFTGTDSYLTSPALQAAVNCALALTLAHRSSPSNLEA